MASVTHSQTSAAFLKAEMNLRHGSNECGNFSSDELIMRWPLASLEAFFSRLLNRSIVTLCYA